VPRGDRHSRPNNASPPVISRLPVKIESLPVPRPAPPLSLIAIQNGGVLRCGGGLQSGTLYRLVSLRGETSAQMMNAFMTTSMVDQSG